MIQALLDSMRDLAGLDCIRPEIVVADNNSEDKTWDVLQRVATSFPIPLTIIKVQKRGKSAVVNEAIRLTNGTVVAFLDDDVIPERGWLEAIERFAVKGTHQVGQGQIQLPSPESEDPEIQKLIQRFRTIPRLEFKSGIERLHSLNGANFAIFRKALEQVGPFDERL